MLISQGGIANDAEGEQRREEYEDHVVHVETAKELKIFLRHRPDLSSLWARNGADAANILEGNRGQDYQGQF